MRRKSSEKVKRIVRELQETREHRYYTGGSFPFPQASQFCDSCDDEDCDHCEAMSYAYFDVAALGRIFGIYDIEHLDQEVVTNLCEKYRYSDFDGCIGYDLSQKGKLRFVLFGVDGPRPTAKLIEFDPRKCASTNVEDIFDWLLDEFFCPEGHKNTRPYFSDGVELISA